MTTSRLLLSAAFLALAAPGLAAQQPVQPAVSQPAQPVAAPPAQRLPRITLQEALRLALESQPAMVQARQGVRTAAMGERQALGAFLPTVRGTASGSQSGAERYNQATGQRVVNPFPYSESYGLSASMDLFTGFRRGANRRAASANTDLSEANATSAEYSTVRDTKVAFFAALAAAELVTVAEAQFRRADEQLRLASEKLRLGATTRSDSLRARVEYGNSQLQLISANGTLLYSQLNLGATVGVDGPVQPVADSTLELRLGPLDTATLRREAMSSAPAIRRAEASLAAARAALAANRAQWLPTVSANANKSWSRSTGGITDSIPFQPQWSISLSFSYPIFNGFTREYSIVSADAAVVNAQATLRNARLILEAQLSQEIANLDGFAAQIDIGRVTVAAAEEDLRMQRERYRLGTSTIVELLTSQSALFKAQADFVQARFNYLVSRAKIEALVGHSL